MADWIASLGPWAPAVGGALMALAALYGTVATRELRRAQTEAARVSAVTSLLEALEQRVKLLEEHNQRLLARVVELEGRVAELLEERARLKRDLNRVKIRLGNLIRWARSLPPDVLKTAPKDLWENGVEAERGE